MKLRPHGWFFGLAFAAGMVGSSLPAQAVPTQYRLYIDRDNNAATGCTVAVPSGSLSGIEEILTTFVNTTGPSSAVVDQVTQEICTSPPSTFSAPAVVNPGDWPVGIGNGVSGQNVTETYWPLPSPKPSFIRVALVAVPESGASDEVLVTSQGGATPIVIQLASVIEVPTLSTWGAVGLATLLFAAGFWVLRQKKQRRSAAILLLVLATATSVYAAAVVFDGQIGDWAPGTQVATDSGADGSLGSNVVALFAQLDSAANLVAFRIDGSLQFNDPPVANDQSPAAGNEDTAQNLTLTGSDGDGDPLTFSIVTPPTGGTLSALTNPTATSADVTYTPNLNFNGADSFVFQVADGLGGTDTGTVTLAVTAINDPPVADNDGPYAVAESGTLAQPAAGGVLTGDTDAEGSALNAVLDVGPLHASSFTLNADGSFSYTHDGSETTSDSFTYHANDGGLDSNVATATITITAVNDAPVADADGPYSVNEGALLTEPVGTGVLSGDTDPEGSTLTAVLDVGPLHASSFTLNADGSFSYTHDGSETTSDSFTYHAFDGALPSNIATATITVTPVNDPPVADNDGPYAVNEGGSLVVPAATGALNGDTDPDTGSLTAVLDAGPANASSFTLNADGSFSYTHDGGETTSDSFTYHAFDGALPSNIATVSITVTPVNDAPVADNDGPYGVNEGGTLNTLAASGVLIGDTDPEANPLTAVLDVGPTNAASFTLNADGSFSYTHNGTDSTSDSFTYHAFDGALPSNIATATITITPVDDLPALDLDANDSGGTAGNNYAITFTDGEAAKFLEDVVDATITDVDSANLSTLTVTLTNLLDATFEVLDVDLTGANVAFSKAYDTITLPGQGVLTITASPTRPIAEWNTLLRKVTYVNTDDNLDTTGRAIGFVANDGAGNSPAATTTVTMVAVNDPPTADADGPYSVNEAGTLNQPAATGVLDGDVDPEGATLNAVLNVGPANASSFTLNADGSFSYTHNGGETTTDSFTYHANDGGLDSNIATVSITVTAVNDPPTADNDGPYSVNEGALLTVPAGTGVLNGDTDPEGTTLTAVLDVGPANASSFTLNADGSFSYTHNGSETTSDSFTYHAFDGAANSNIATVSITVNPVNDAPVADNDGPYSVNEGALLTVPAGTGVLNGDTDVDSGSLTAVLDVGPANASAFTLNADGSFSYTHNGGETTSDSFTYHAFDGAANSNIATVTITVNPVNDAPVADNDGPYSVNEGALLAVPAGTGVLNGDTDVDSGSLTAVLDVGPANASSFTLNADGSFSYTHDGSETISDSFTYHAFDGALPSNIATVTITISPVNDPPVANPDTADINEEAPNVVAANTVSGNTLTNDTDPDGPPLVVSAVAGGSVGAPRAGTYGSVTINSNGSYTYTLDDTHPTVNALAPGQTLLDAFGYTASDTLLNSSSTLTVTIHGADDPPTPDNDAWDFIGNTELEVDRDTAATPEVLATTPAVPAALGVLDGDIDPDGGPAITISAIVGCADVSAPFDCTLAGQGIVSLQADGSLSFIPEPGDTDATASFQYTLTGNPAPATVTLTRFERVWYVDNDSTAGGLGRSFDPFDTLAEAETASVANDYIFVHFGDGATTGQAAGITLKSGQHLIGEHAGLSIPVNLNANGSPTVLHAGTPGSRPLLDDTTVGAPEGVAATDAIPIEIVGLNLAGNVNGIDLTTNGAFAGSGSLEIRDNVIRSSTFEGLDVTLAGTGTVNLSIHDNTITAGVNGIDVLRTAGTVRVTAFDDNVVSGNTGGFGISLNGVIVDSTPGNPINVVSGGATVIGASGNGVGTHGMLLANMIGDLSFTDLDIVNDGGIGLGVTSTGALNAGAGTGFRVVVGAGVATIDSNGGAGVNIVGASANLPLAFYESTNSTNNGLNLTNAFGGVGGTTFSVSSGLISDPVGASNAAVLVDGGNGNVTIGIPVTNNSGNAVAVSNRTGDTVSFSAQITETGSGLTHTTNTGATINYTGGITASTGTNGAFNATGGGTISVTGAANTLTTTTGTALNVASTTIGASGLTFLSIASNGGASAGIVLNSTGVSSGLTVTGTGGAGTGGTIQNKTGDGVSLQNTRFVSLSRMIINNNDGSGIFGDDLTNFSLLDSTVSNNGDVGGGTEGDLRFNELLGTSVITNSLIFGGIADGIRMTPASGTLSSLTISGSTIGPTPAGNGMAIVSSGTAVVNVTINGGTVIRNSFASGFLTTINGTSLGVSVDAVTFQDNNIGFDLGNGVNSDVTATVTNSTFLRHASNAINLVTDAGSTNAAAYRVTLNGNQIGDTNVDSGSMNTFGIAGDFRGDVDAVVSISNNTIRHTDQEGIFIQGRLDNDADAEVGLLDLTLRDNSVANIDDNSAFPFGALYGTRVESRNTYNLCLDIFSNTSTSVGGLEHFRARQRDTSTFRAERLALGSQNAATMASHLVAQNDAGSTGSATVATNFTGVADGTCRTP